MLINDVIASTSEGEMTLKLNVFPEYWELLVIKSSFKTLYFKEVSNNSSGSCPDWYSDEEA